MNGSVCQPKVFISYSWTTVQHEKWVLDLAERLSSDGVSVVLDKWDLREGQDKHVFMEQMVQDSAITKVLVVCDIGYQRKADDRKGGVGTETQIISKEVYENTDQEKFIPIVRDYDDRGNPCIPHFMASRIYIDLSSDAVFEENYQKLVRNLYGKPLLRRPPVGSAPAYIKNDQQVFSTTAAKLRPIKDALLNDRPSLGGLISDFLEAVIDSLEQYRISADSSPTFDDKVLESIDKMLPLRDDVLEFMSVLFKYKSTVDLDRLHEFLEKLLGLCYRPEYVSSWSDTDYDNYTFFSYELMLSFIALLLKLTKVSEAAYFINNQYFYRNSLTELKYSDVTAFNQYVRSLNETRNARLGLRRVSLTADLIKSRATNPTVGFADILQADLVLYYTNELLRERWGWYPHTSIYAPHAAEVRIFARMLSRKHFDKVKILFGVSSVEELKVLIADYLERRTNDPMRYRTGSINYSIRPLERVLDPQVIGSLP